MKINLFFDEQPYQIVWKLDKGGMVDLIEKAIHTKIMGELNAENDKILTTPKSTEYKLPILLENLKEQQKIK